MDDLIIRPRYLKKVVPFIDKQLIKVFTGQRRVGKSYILKQTIQHILQNNEAANIIYINKENIDFDWIKDATQLNQYIISKTNANTKNYVFIDEIQEVAEFEKALRSLLLDVKYDLYCTGSNAYILSSELSTFLGGRYIEIPVYSLSYNEFQEFQNLENTDDTLMKYLKFGGLPYLKHLELNEDIITDYLKGIYNTVIYRDVIKRNEVRNSAFLENLILFLADNIGQLFSSRKISNYLKSQNVKIATSQIIAYTQHLCNAYLIYRVKRIDIVGKKLFEIGEKYYFEDLGLRNTIYKFKQDDIGKIMENIVFNHLMQLGYKVNIGQKDNYEIDFVAERGGELKYIQVCYLLHEDSTIQREFGNLERIKDNYPKMVVSMDNFKGNSRNGIDHIYLLDFLSNDKF